MKRQSHPERQIQKLLHGEALDDQCIDDLLLASPLVRERARRWRKRGINLHDARGEATRMLQRNFPVITIGRVQS